MIKPHRELKNIKSTQENILMTLSAGDWWRLLKENRFAVSPMYWRRILAITLLSPLNSLARYREKQLYGDKIDDVVIKEPPLFILGHMRSGTTHLHYLMSQDTDQFAFPSIYQSATPHTFLSSEEYALKQKMAEAKKRPQDNVVHSIVAPGEEEYAMMFKCFKSVMLSHSFPRHAAHYRRYLTFKGVDESELQEYKDAFIWFLKKLTLKYDKKLLLKSTTHTAKVGIMRSVFPTAKFLNIHRNPYHVFRSMRHTYETVHSHAYLQRPDLDGIDDEIIKIYKLMYEAYLEDRKSVPAGHLHEISYTELTADRLKTIEGAYKALDLPGFDTFKPKLMAYLDTIKSYKKNTYAPLDPEIVEKINHEWKHTFEAFGYEQMKPGE